MADVRVTMGPAKMASRICGLALGGLGLLGLLAAQGGRWSPWLDISAHLAPIWLGLSLIGSLAALAGSPAGARGLALALIGAGVLIGGAMVLPELAAREAAGTAKPGDLTLIQFNVWADNPAPRQTADWILAQKADVVILEEADSRGALVRALTAAYPWVTTCTTPYTCPTLILSKARPLAQSRIGNVRPRGPTPEGVAWAVLPWRGCPLPVAGVHLSRPFTPGLQQDQGLDAARFAASLDRGRLILTGDFNSTPWSFFLKRMDAALGLKRRTHGEATWPAQPYSRFKLPAPFPVVAIDQIYAGADWRTVSVRRGPRLGSDHYPLVAVLRPR